MSIEQLHLLHALQQATARRPSAGGGFTLGQHGAVEDHSDVEDDHSDVEDHTDVEQQPMQTGDQNMATTVNEQVCWPGYITVMASNLRSLIGSEKFSDVTLFTESGKIPGHKMILSTCSQYFRELFDQFNNDHPLIVIKDVSHQTLLQLLEFMYTGSVSVRRDNLAAFIDAGKAFKIDGLDCVSEDIKVDDDDDVQGKELDLSQNSAARQACPSTPVPFPPDRVTVMPKFIAPQQAHLNHAMLNPNAFSPFDSTLFNTALAMRTNPQYLSAQLGSPARASIQSQNLPRQSPHKLYRSCSPKRHTEDILRQESVALSNRRYSNSPEDSTNSNASLDLSKATADKSPLERINAVNRSLSSLVSARQTLSANSPLNPVSAVLASKLQQYQQQFQPQIRVAQSVLVKRNSSRSPEPIDIKVRRMSQDRVPSPNRYSHNLQDPSPHHSAQSVKQNSSGSSSEHNNYSDEESGAENRDDDSGGRSVSPGPSTSTPRVNESFSHKPSYTLPWSYAPCVEDGAKPIIEPPGGTADILKALIHVNNSGDYRRDLLGHGPPVALAFPGISHGLPQLPILPQTLANIQALTSSANTFSNAVSSLGSLNLAGSLPHHVMAMMSSQPDAAGVTDHQRNLEDGGGHRKRKIHSMTARFTCDKCPRSYASHGNLKRHVKYECGQAPQFACPCCEVRFQHRHSMKIHFRSAHKEHSERFPHLVDNVPDQNRTHDPAVTDVTNHSPSSSPNLQIAEEGTDISNFIYNQVPPSFNMDQRIPVIRTPADNSREQDNSLQTIATAEVSVASVTSQNVDTDFVALQRAQTQNSNADGM